MRHTGTWSRAHVNRASHASGGLQFAERPGLLCVNALGQRIRTIHILLDDGNPVIREVAGQLELHPRIIDRNHARQDERTLVALLPKAVDHRGHKTKDPSGALEFYERAPCSVQLVEDFRMNRIRSLDASFVVVIPAFGWKLCALRVVEIRESACRDITVLELITSEGLEQAAPNDLEALLGCSWTPR